jgi:phosphohistidine phosphatase
MRLYLLRHAWAGEYGDPRYPNDEARPLTAGGIKRFRNWLSTLDCRQIELGTIFTSPYLRCRQTAELIREWHQEVAESAPQFVLIDELGCGAKLENVLRVVRECELRGNWMCVGHMPDLGQMASALIGDGQAAIRFSKGALAAIEFADQPAVGQGTLLWLAAPKVTGG